jgi:thioredoxin-related protein
MKRIKKLNNKTKFYIVVTLILLCLTLTIFGTIYALKHNHEGYVISTGDLPVKYTASSNQVDNITLPTPNITVTTDKLPNQTGTLTEVDLATFKKLFQSSTKSIVTLEKDGCSYCEDFEPKFVDALEYFSIKAYKINISKLSNDELSELYNYVDFTGTPTTYIVNNGNAVHSYTGTADVDTLAAFIEYFYVRSN